MRVPVEVVRVVEAGLAQAGDWGALVPASPLMSSDTVAAAVAVLPESVSARPRSMPHKRWAVLRDFVLAATVEAVVVNASEARYDVRRVVLVVVRLVDWATGVAGYPMEREAVFDRQVIDAFVNQGLPGYTASSRGSHRSLLLRVSEQLTASGKAYRRLVPLPPSPGCRHFTAAEQHDLRLWAAGQRNAMLGRGASVLLALGFGAGLRAGEIGALRRADITRDDVGTLVRVRGGVAPRTVPMLTSWQDLLHRGLDPDATNADAFVFRPNSTVRTAHHLIGNLVERTNDLPVRPSPHRLRASWIIEHMAAAAPMAELMAAAGLTSLEALTRYLPYVPKLEPGLARRLMHDPSPHA